MQETFLPETHSKAPIEEAAVNFQFTLHLPEPLRLVLGKVTQMVVER